MKLQNVEIMRDYVLRIYLDDGSIIDFNFKAEVDRISCYKPLYDPELFQAVKFKNQRIYWNDRFDFHLDQIMQHGYYVQ
jgi:hypothetical protein